MSVINLTGFKQLAFSSFSSFLRIFILSPRKEMEIFSSLLTASSFYISDISDYFSSNVTSIEIDSRPLNSFFSPFSWIVSFILL